jgi:uncharacterized protein
MRRKEKEITDQSLLEKILNEAVACRIAMVDGSTPYIVPMNFGYETGCLYLHSAREGRKLDVLRQNPNVCFEAEVGAEIIEAPFGCNWSMKYMSIIGSGKAVFLSEASEKRKALDTIIQKYTRIMKGASAEAVYEYPDNMVNAVEIIRIDISEMTGKKSGEV